jgi:large subunit ribosomal protein L30e
MVDVKRILKNFVTKGKVKIGLKETKKAIAKGSAKIVIIANNCIEGEEIKKLASKKKIPVYNYDGTGLELGYVCGKPFNISAFAVLEATGSDITHLIKKK